MFTLDTGTMEAFVSAVQVTFDNLIPLLAVFVGLPVLFYIVQRLKKMFPRMRR